FRSEVAGFSSAPRTSRLPVPQLDRILPSIRRRLSVSSYLSSWRRECPQNSPANPLSVRSSQLRTPRPGKRHRPCPPRNCLIPFLHLSPCKTRVCPIRRRQSRGISVV